MKKLNYLHLGATASGEEETNAGWFMQGYTDSGGGVDAHTDPRTINQMVDCAPDLTIPAPSSAMFYNSANSVCPNHIKGNDTTYSVHDQYGVYSPSNDQIYWITNGGNSPALDTIGVPLAWFSGIGTCTGFSGKDLYAYAINGYPSSTKLDCCDGAKTDNISCAICWCPHSRTCELEFEYWCAQPMTGNVGEFNMFQDQRCINWSNSSPNALAVVNSICQGQGLQSSGCQQQLGITTAPSVSSAPSVSTSPVPPVPPVSSVSTIEIYVMGAIIVVALIVIIVMVVKRK